MSASLHRINNTNAPSFQSNRVNSHLNDCIKTNLFQRLMQSTDTDNNNTKHNSQNNNDDNPFVVSQTEQEIATTQHPNGKQHGKEDHYSDATINNGLINAVSSGDTSNSDILLLVTAFNEMCRTIRFIRQSSVTQPATTSPVSCHSSQQENRTALHNEVNEEAVNQDINTVNGNANHSTPNDNDHSIHDGQQSYNENVNGYHTIRSFHPHQLILSSTPLESIKGIDSKLTADFAGIKGLPPSALYGQSRTDEKYKNEDEELDLFKVNKEQDPRVVSPDTRRENVQPIANSALLNRQKPTKPSPIKKTVSEPSHNDKYLESNIQEPTDRQALLLNGYNISTGELKRPIAAPKSTPLSTNYSAILAQPHVFSGTTMQERPLSKNHIEEDMKINENIMSRFPGIRLTDDPAVHGLGLSTTINNNSNDNNNNNNNNDDNQPNESVKGDEEQHANASYCGTNDCGYCPSHAPVMSPTKNDNFPPPLPEFFQSANKDLKLFASLEEETEGTHMNEEVDSECLQRSPVISTVDEMLAELSPRRTAATMMEEDAHNDPFATTSFSQTAQMSSLNNIDTYQQSSNHVEYGRNSPTHSTMSVNNWDSERQRMDRDRDSSPRTMSRIESSPSVISLPQNISAIYHHLGFSETLDPPPITPRILKAIRTTLDIEHDHNDARFWGICLLGFYGMLSPDELPDPVFRDAVSEPRSIHWKGDLAVMNKPTPYHEDCTELSLYWMAIPASRSSKVSNASTASSILCPVAAIQQWLSIEACGAPRRFVPSPIAGQISNMGKLWLENRLQDALIAAQLDDFMDEDYRKSYQLDSLRFGGAVCAYEARVAVDKIRLVGGWDTQGTLAKSELSLLAKMLSTHVNKCTL
ncbi:hypothetical protein BDF22DRAFT_740855 [Syncephalis plumigaleata]|nr:hypothetical protein BDF22DRAFT_740855 [Syncephalis plumigaleata]